MRNLDAVFVYQAYHKVSKASALPFTKIGPMAKEKQEEYNVPHFRYKENSVIREIRAKKTKQQKSQPHDPSPNLSGGITMDFYTTVLRKSGPYWVALCLENGIVGQGHTKETAVANLKEAIDSIEEVREVDKNIYSAPLSIKELHEFLMVEGLESVSEPLEMRALYA